jgi:hypothetical protein
VYQASVTRGAEVARAAVIGAGEAVKGAGEKMAGAGQAIKVPGDDQGRGEANLPKEEK